MNGNFAEVGETRRRYIVVSSVELIGKEAKKVGASGESDPAVVTQASYGVTYNI